MIVWRSQRVRAMTTAYATAKIEAECIARDQKGRAEWQDEYNDHSVQGCWVVRV